MNPNINNNNGQRHPPSNYNVINAAAPPRSTLASLLSSQRRSAVQSHRHRVQRALPFANLQNDAVATADGGIVGSDPATGGGGNIKSLQRVVKGGPSGGATSNAAVRQTVAACSSQHRPRDLVQKADRRSDITANGSLKEAASVLDVVFGKPHVDTTQRSEQYTVDAIKQEKISFVEPVNTADSQPKKKKKKEPSPFRIKVGCVVAVRFRKLGEGGNAEVRPVVKVGDSFSLVESAVEGDTIKPLGKESSAEVKSGSVNAMKDDNEDAFTKKKAAGDAAAEEGIETKRKRTESIDSDKPQPKLKGKRKPKLCEVWTTPIPGRDDGISLLGSRIRCSFPKSLLVTWQKGNQNGNKVSLGRVLEGNIVSILDNEEGAGYETSVGLLVDQATMKNLPYLQVLSEDSNDVNLSSSEQKRRKLETLIRGKNKVVVKVTLASIYDRRKGDKPNYGVVTQWVVGKHVYAKPSGLKPTKKERKREGYGAQSLFVGDGNDTQLQQENNWRWIASQCQLPAAEQSETMNNVGELASQLVGEVVKMEICPNSSHDGSGSLATVAIRRLCTPEQTKGGRQTHHGALELFECTVGKCGACSYFQAPVEDLIVIGKRINRYFDASEQTNTTSAIVDGCFSVTHSYDAIDNTYTPIPSKDGAKRPLNLCHYCRRRCPNSTMKQCQYDSCIRSMWCSCCATMIGSPAFVDNDEPWVGSCCLGKCDCAECITGGGSSCIERCATCDQICQSGRVVKCYQCAAQLHKECADWQSALASGGNIPSASEQFACLRCSHVEAHLESSKDLADANNNITQGIAAALSSLTASLKSARPMDFELPNGIGDLSLKPSFVPKTGNANSRQYKSSSINKRKAKKPKTDRLSDDGERRAKKPKTKTEKSAMKRKRALSVAESKPKSKKQQSKPKKDVADEDHVFKPTCCRTIPFEQIKKNHWYLSHGKTASKDEGQPIIRENARARKVVIRKVEEKGAVTGRAARASQRRMLKSLASLGDASKTVDRLVSRDREERLRFDKSLIHGWGVFAEEAINAGDMIIEYRGELIGNAVADKRELEYERAKIGSDYMFRIDEFWVCDATKLGNVARFINASCCPNCYTKIITANETKRIVIFAKKNIQRGEELCYDYKFQMEHEKEKRIPCYCGSSECRGFMNWVSVLV